jgi:hypothetical protein
VTIYPSTATGMARWFPLVGTCTSMPLNDHTMTLTVAAPVAQQLFLLTSFFDYFSSFSTIFPFFRLYLYETIKGRAPSHIKIT